MKEIVYRIVRRTPDKDFGSVYHLVSDTALRKTGNLGFAVDVSASKLKEAIIHGNIKVANATGGKDGDLIGTESSLSSMPDRFGKNASGVAVALVVAELHTPAGAPSKSESWYRVVFGANVVDVPESYLIRAVAQGKFVLANAKIISKDGAKFVSAIKRPFAWAMPKVVVKGTSTAGESLSALTDRTIKINKPVEPEHKGIHIKIDKPSVPVSTEPQTVMNSEMDKAVSEERDKVYRKKQRRMIVDYLYKYAPSTINPNWCSSSLFKPSNMGASPRCKKEFELEQRIWKSEILPMTLQYGTSKEYVDYLSNQSRINPIDLAPLIPKFVLVLEKNFGYTGLKGYTGTGAGVNAVLGAIYARLGQGRGYVRGLDILTDFSIIASLLRVCDDWGDDDLLHFICGNKEMLECCLPHYLKKVCRLFDIAGASLLGFMRDRYFRLVSELRQKMSLVQDFLPKSDVLSKLGFCTIPVVAGSQRAIVAYTPKVRRVGLTALSVVAPERLVNIYSFFATKNGTSFLDVKYDYATMLDYLTKHPIALCYLLTIEKQRFWKRGIEKKCDYESMVSAITTSDRATVPLHSGRDLWDTSKDTVCAITENLINFITYMLCLDGGGDSLIPYVVEQYLWYNPAIAQACAEHPKTSDLLVQCGCPMFVNGDVDVRVLVDVLIVQAKERRTTMQNCYMDSLTLDSIKNGTNMSIDEYIITKLRVSKTATVSVGIYDTRDASSYNTIKPITFWDKALEHGLLH